ncbi:response regulator [Terasakiella sp. SH-1]|uniref:response regulator n=1 Tax=Terasakiella sp. SH-1 TaxID=2560057 RepID=UPI001073BC22|nr:response regulator [Terasakiella sp. SH-1]
MPTILFVDDEINVLGAMKRSFRHMGDNWSFLFADCAPLAIDILNRIEKVDVVVTDVMMPRVDGKELVKKILAEYPQTKPIVLSGQCDDAAKAEFERMKVPFYNKPFPMEELKEKIVEMTKS